MAARLQEAARIHERVLFVGRFRSIQLISELLEKSQAIPLMKVDNAKSVVAPLHPESLRKGFTEIPRITENYENWRRDRDTDFPADRHE
jgi:hypothetical protein